MSSKTKVLIPPGRPSSPRKFFARIYGHLETRKEEKKKDIKTPGEKSPKVNDSSDRVDLCDEEVTEIERRLSDERPDTRTREPEVTWSKRAEEDERRPEKGPSLPPLDQPFLPHGFLPGGSTHSMNLTHLAHQNLTQQHLPGLPLHGQSDNHLLGYSAFRK